MTDITALAAGTAVGGLVGALIAGWWAAARLRRRFHNQVMETAERAQRAEAVAAELRRQAELERVEVAELRHALAESQQARVAAEPTPWQGFDHSLVLRLPPLAVLVLAPEPG